MDPQNPLHYHTPHPGKHSSDAGEVSEAHLPEILQTFQTLNQDPGVEGAAKQLAALEQTLSDKPNESSASQKHRLRFEPGTLHRRGI